MKKFRTIVSIAVFSLVAGFIGAQPAPFPGGPDRLSLLKHFGLTDDQAKQVGDLMAKEQTAVVPLKAQLKVLNAQIEQAMTATNTDLKAVNALVDKKTQLRADIEKQFLAVATQVHQIVGDQIFYELSKAFLAHHRMGAMAERGERMGRYHPQDKPDGPRMMGNPPIPEKP